MIRLDSKKKHLGSELFNTAESSVVSTYSSREAAEHAINVLVTDGFNPTQFTIKGNGVYAVERVTGKITYAKAAFAGVFSGIYFGIGIALIALISGLLKLENLGNAIYGIMVIGIGLGVLLAVITHSFSKNSRSYTSVSQIMCERYDLFAASTEISATRAALQAHAETEHS